MRSYITTITKKDTTQTCARNLGSQKTSIGFGNLHVDDWSKKRGSGMYLFYLLSSPV